jgi:hypothetical protein
VESTTASLFIHSRGVSVVGLTGWSILPTIIVTTCAVILWQYARRNAIPARIVMFAVACGFIPAILTLPHLAASPSGEHASTRSSPGVRVFYDPKRPPAPVTTEHSQPPGFVLARIPLEVEGLPTKTLLRGHVDMTINVNGTSWPAPGHRIPGFVERIGGEYWDEMDLQRFPVISGPANLHASLYLAIVTDEVETRIPLGEPSFVIPDVGRCHTFQQTASIQFACVAGLQPVTETSIRLEGPGGSSESVADFMPTSVPWGISPTTLLGLPVTPNAPAGAQLSVIPRHQIATFQRTLDLTNVQLSRYILTR